MAKKDKLRLINSKIKPAFKTEEMCADEERGGEGECGKGPLVRRYSDNLDMEFIAYQSRERRDQETAPVTVKLPLGVLDDISVMVQSSKLPFKDRSQFVRTAVIILANYYGQKFPMMAKKMKLQNGIEACNFEMHQKKMIKSYIESFEKVMPYLESKSEQEIDKFLQHHAETINSFWDEKVKKDLKERFTQILEENGISATPYFSDGGEEGQG
jgi:hypothetical protein